MEPASVNLAIMLTPPVTAFLSNARRTLTALDPTKSVQVATAFVKLDIISTLLDHAWLSNAPRRPNARPQTPTKNALPEAVSAKPVITPA